MARSSSIDWLKKELPTWVQTGLVDDATANRIEAHYAHASDTGRTWVLALFGVLGGLLVGLGIILLLAYNWADLSRPVRTLLSLTPLMVAQGLAGWGLHRNTTSSAWREGVGLFWTLTLGASIALVAQTYHIPGDAGRFVLVWSLLTLTVMYGLRASLPVLLYMAGILWWSVDALHATGYDLYLWPLLALVLPHVVTTSRLQPYAALAVLMHIGLIILITSGVVLSMVFLKVDTGMLVLLFLAAAYYLIDQRLFSESVGRLRRPFHVAGACTLVIMAFVLTHEDAWRAIRFTLELVEIGALDLVRVGVLAFVLVTAAVMLARVAVKGPHAALWLGLVPVLAVVGKLLVEITGSPMVSMVLMNVYLLALGLHTLVHGFRRCRVGEANIGLLIVLSLIALRFFDEDLGFVVRGVLFVLLGLAFLAANWRLAQRKKRAT